MNIIGLYRDFGVDFKTEGHKHTRPGWVNTACPFCTGNPGYHLGYNAGEEYFYCWRCGGHGAVKTVAALLQVPTKQAYHIIQQYEGITKVKIPEKEKKQLLLPQLGELTPKAIRYLERRKFDVEKLQRDWNIQYTKPPSIIEKSNYAHRIFIPIYWLDKGMVSFQTRTISDKVDLRYKACPQNRERIEHKQILYGKPTAWSMTGICVEGVTDVWRLGPAAVATFGIKFKPSQVRWLAKLFKRVPVVFDDDPQAITQAKKLVAELRVRGVDAFRVPIVGDPGAMEQSEADYLVKQLLS